jgi:hypothetical protein
MSWLTDHRPFHHPPSGLIIGGPCGYRWAVFGTARAVLCTSRGLRDPDSIKHLGKRARVQSNAEYVSWVVDLVADTLRSALTSLRELTSARQDPIVEDSLAYFSNYDDGPIPSPFPPTPASHSAPSQRTGSVESDGSDDETGVTRMIDNPDFSVNSGPTMSSETGDAPSAEMPAQLVAGVGLKQPEVRS